MYTLLSILWRLIDAYQMLIIVGVFLSWIPRTPGGAIDQIDSTISRLTDPFLDLFRSIIPTFGGSGFAIDFSPVVAIVVLDLLKRLL